MLLEESSQWSIHLKGNDKNFECQSLNVAVPPLAALSEPLRPFSVPISPRDWFGNQNTFNSWHQSSNNTSVLSKPTTVAPSTPNWVCKSSGLYSGKECGNSHFSMFTKTSLRGSQPHETTRHAGLHAQDCCFPGDGVSRSSAGHGIVTDPRCKKNIHSSGGYWFVDASCESDNFTCDTYEVPTRELEHPKSAYSKTHDRKERCCNKEFLYRQENLGEEFKGKRGKKIHRSRRERWNNRIRRKGIKAFAKSIGYINYGSHIFFSNILGYIIKSKLVCRSCKSWQGSIFLQYQIINSTRANHTNILEQIFEQLVSICNDKFGNHVVQSFFQLGNPSVEREILLRMKSSLCDVAMNEYGNRVLQRAILLVNDELLRIVTDVLVPNAYMLAMNSFGHYVLQRVIARGSRAMVQVLLANVIGRQRNSRLIELSKDEFGCIIIQRMLQYAHTPERHVIITTIMGSTHDLCALCQDRYGNYVIKHILRQFREKHSMAVMDALDGKFSKMAKNMFCSHVLEMLYKHGGRDVEDRLIKLVDCNLLKEFLNDKFANYLVQTMLTAGKPENQKKIRRLLQKIPHLPKLKYGKLVRRLL